MIPYGRQDIRQEDIDAVCAVLTSDFLTQGPAVNRFEAVVAAYAGAKYAVAMNSATSALHIACAALDLGPGDLLWTSPITFVASSNCALYCGADIDFVDIDPRTFNLCHERLSEKLAKTRAEGGRLPKIVVAVHMCGQSCEMALIAELAKEYGFRVIEDASHAVGGKYKGAPVGNCAFSDVVVFSFHPVKIVTTAEGGMALTNNLLLAQKMQLLRSHGITRDPDLMTHVPDGPWYYQQIALGYNYRMSDLQAALGISQASRIDEYVSKRHQIADMYDNAFRQLELDTPWRSPDAYSSFHLYVVRLKDSKLHAEVFANLRAYGIGVNLHYIPVHLQPFYQRMGFRSGDFPLAEAYYSAAISLPMYPTMTDVQQEMVIDGVKGAISALI